MFCRNCGTQLREGARFCPKCGTPVNSTAGNGGRVPSEKWGSGTQTTYNYQSSAAKKETRIPFFLIAAIMILAAVVVIIFRACSDSGYKKVKTIKPGKTAVIKKIKNKVFRSGKTYYISIQTNTKKNIPCSNFYYDEITF